jgi:hypothetical protein
MEQPLPSEQHQEPEWAEERTPVNGEMERLHFSSTIDSFLVRNIGEALHAGTYARALLPACARAYDDNVIDHLFTFVADRVDPFIDVYRTEPYSYTSEPAQQLTSKPPADFMAVYAQHAAQQRMRQRSAGRLDRLPNGEWVDSQAGVDAPTATTVTAFCAAAAYAAHCIQRMNATQAVAYNEHAGKSGTCAIADPEVRAVDEHLTALGHAIQQALLHEFGTAGQEPPAFLLSQEEYTVLARKHLVDVLPAIDRCSRCREKVQSLQARRDAARQALEAWREHVKRRATEAAADAAANAFNARAAIQAVVDDNEMDQRRASLLRLGNDFRRACIELQQLESHWLRELEIGPSQ